MDQAPQQQEPETVKQIPQKIPTGQLDFAFLQSKLARKRGYLFRESLTPLEQHRSMELIKFNKVEVPAVAKHGVLGRDVSEPHATELVAECLAGLVPE